MRIELTWKMSHIKYATKSMPALYYFQFDWNDKNQRINWNIMKLYKKNTPKLPKKYAVRLSTTHAIANIFRERKVRNNSNFMNKKENHVGDFHFKCFSSQFRLFSRFLYGSWSQKHTEVKLISITFMKSTWCPCASLHFQYPKLVLQFVKFSIQNLCNECCWNS